MGQNTTLMELFGAIDLAIFAVPPVELFTAPIAQWGPASTSCPRNAEIVADRSDNYTLSTAASNNALDAEVSTPRAIAMEVRMPQLTLHSESIGRLSGP
jgi:hypothetical protein